MGSISITTPYPPTVNHYWQARVELASGKWPPPATPGRRVKFSICRAGREFRRQVGTEIMVARAEALRSGLKLPFAGPVFIVAMVYPPDLRKRDLDNILKPLLDALQHNGLIVDDSDVSQLMVKRCRPVKGGRVEVTVTAAV